MYFPYTDAPISLQHFHLHQKSLQHHNQALNHIWTNLEEKNGPKLKLKRHFEYIYYVIIACCVKKKIVRRKRLLYFRH